MSESYAMASRSSTRKRNTLAESQKDRGIYRLTFQEYPSVNGPAHAAACRTVLTGASSSEIEADLLRIRDSPIQVSDGNTYESSYSPMRSAYERNPPLNDVPPEEIKDIDYPIDERIRGYQCSADDILPLLGQVQREKERRIAESQFVVDGLLRELSHLFDRYREVYFEQHSLRSSISTMLQQEEETPLVNAVFDPPLTALHVFNHVCFSKGSNVLTPFGPGVVEESEMGRTRVRLPFGYGLFVGAALFPPESLEFVEPECPRSPPPIEIEAATSEDFLFWSDPQGIPPNRPLLLSTVVRDGSKAISFANSEHPLDPRYAEWEEIQRTIDIISAEEKRTENAIAQLERSQGLLQKQKEVLGDKCGAFLVQLQEEQAIHRRLTERLSFLNEHSKKDQIQLSLQIEELEQDVFERKFLSEEELAVEKSISNDD